MEYLNISDSEIKKHANLTREERRNLLTREDLSMTRLKQLKKVANYLECDVIDLVEEIEIEDKKK